MLRVAVHRRSGLVATVLAVVVAVGGVAAQGAQGATPTAAGAFVAVTPTRLVNTYTGAFGNLHGALRGRATTSPQLGGHGGVPSSGVAAVALTLTVQQPAASGALVAWKYGTRRPGTANVQFAAGQRAAQFAIVRVSATGRINLYNRSSQALQVLVDVSGYYLAGTPTARRALHPVTPSRIADTRAGGYGSVRAGATRTLAVGGHGRVPAAGVDSVALTINLFAPPRSGTLTAYAAGRARPGLPTGRFPGGRSSSLFTIVPVSASGRITVYNGSSRAIDFALDVAGYFLDGVATRAGTLQRLPVQRVLDTRHAPIARSTSRSVTVRGKAGVPLTGVQSVAVVVSVISPASAGGVTAWGGRSRPRVTNVQFSTGRSTSDVALVQVSSTGKINLYNASSRGLSVFVDVVGFVRGTTITPPPVSTGRYVRNISGAPSDAATMDSEGCQDGRDGSALVLLELGAQSMTGRLAGTGGIALTQTNPVVRVTYSELSDALTGYLNGFHRCAPEWSATIALGTNNDGVFSDSLSAYPAPDRGKDWANRLVDPLRSAAPSGLDVVAANDIEAGFAGTLAQVRAWERGYYAATDTTLIVNGSLDGCPTDFGRTATPCDRGWTLADYAGLTRHGTQTRVLPQIYVPEQARQWANLDRVTGGRLDVAGSLTEFAADGFGYHPVDGWAALYNALSSVVGSPQIPRAVDLRVDN